MDGMMEAAAVMRGEVLSSVVLNVQIKIYTYGLVYYYSCFDFLEMVFLLFCFATY